MARFWTNYWKSRYWRDKANQHAIGEESDGVCWFTVFFAGRR
jgi:hypothetical protein